MRRIKPKPKPSVEHKLKSGAKIVLVEGDARRAEKVVKAVAVVEADGERAELELALVRAREYSRRQALTTPLDFLRRHYHPITSDGGKIFAETEEKWQTEFIINPLFNEDYNLIYIEAVRDADKTGTTTAAAFAYCYLNSRKIVRQYASDRDQAAICKTVILNRILAHELEVAKTVDVHQNKIMFANGSVYIIESSDAAGVWGKPSDMNIIDELHAWRKEAQESLFHSIISKRGARNIIITNPGVTKNSLCYRVREQVAKQADKYVTNAYFFTMEKTPLLPSWKTKEYLDEQKAILPWPVYQRVHLCRWVFTAASPFSEEDINSIFVSTQEKHSGDEGVHVGADYAYRRDKAAVASLCRDAEGNIHVFNMRMWEARGGQDIDLNDIATHIATLCRSFLYFGTVAFDPYQAMAHKQTLEARYGANKILEFVFSEASRVKLFKHLFSMIRTRRLKVPRNAPLAEELREQLKGLEVDASWHFKHGKRGDDLIVAIGIAALNATEGENPISFDAWAEMFSTDKTEMEKKIDNHFVDQGATMVGDGDDDYDDVDMKIPDTW